MSNENQLAESRPQENQTIPDIMGRDVLNEIKVRNMTKPVGSISIEQCIEYAKNTDAANESMPYFA